MGISGEKQQGRGTSPIVMMMFLKKRPSPLILEYLENL